MNDWGLEKEFKKDYFKEIDIVLKNEKESIFPSKENIYNAFKNCSFGDLKVVIIGQDPYHNDGQAHGLSFSVLSPSKLPPSLKNIYKEIESEYNVDMSKTNGDLTSWSKQGVLLLNSALTVVAHKPGSHSKIGWHTFTSNIVKKISNEKENIIFLLWGAHAQTFTDLIDETKHHILSSSHPSPFSARKSFFGNNHFIKTNEILKENSLIEIDWILK
jgi:uracil-DNA glycosylase